MIKKEFIGNITFNKKSILEAIPSRTMRMHGFSTRSILYIFNGSDSDINGVQLSFNNPNDKPNRRTVSLRTNIPSFIECKNFKGFHPFDQFLVNHFYQHDSYNASINGGDFSSRLTANINFEDDGSLSLNIESSSNQELIYDKELVHFGDQENKYIFKITDLCKSRDGNREIVANFIEDIFVETVHILDAYKRINLLKNDVNLKSFDPLESASYIPNSISNFINAMKCYSIIQDSYK